MPTIITNMLFFWGGGGDPRRQLEHAYTGKLMCTHTNKILFYVLHSDPAVGLWNIEVVHREWPPHYRAKSKARNERSDWNGGTERILNNCKSLNCLYNHNSNFKLFYILCSKKSHLIANNFRSMLA